MSGTALLILNQSAGTGHAGAEADALAAALVKSSSRPVDVAAVDSHPAARAAAARFAAEAGTGSLVVAAGGGGTLRAVVEGVMDASPVEPPPADRLRVGALRMGSGNVIARNLHVPSDPLSAARQIGEGWVSGGMALCSVLRCRHGAARGGGTAVRYAITMAGFGAWGRVPGDIARWRERHAGGRRRVASWVGLERVNLFEYLAFGTGRMLAGAMSGRRCELVELDGRRIRLLAAVVLNLPLPPLPDPQVRMGDEAAGLTVVPRFGRPFRRRLEPGRGMRLRLLDRESIEFFLDEDPEIAYGWIELEVAGRLAFVPGRAV